MMKSTEWKNVLLTDSGFYYENDLDKPINTLINRFQSMLGKPFSEAKLLYIPTAAMTDPDKAAEIKNRLYPELIRMGMLDDNITMYDIDGTLHEDIAMRFDAIYITGGNTPYLAKRVKEAGFDKIIKKMVYANKVYVGMSAGSMLLMPNFNIDNLIPSFPTEFDGLGLINAYFTVHCAPGTPNRTDFSLPHISLQEHQAIEVSSKGYKVLKEN